MTAHWYVVQVLSGHEKKVKRTIEEGKSAAGVSDLIEEIVLPMENIAQMKKGEQKVTQKVVWPGYLLIHMVMTDDALVFIKNTNGVIDFLGDRAPLSEEEADAVLQRVKQGEDVVKHKFDFEINDTVKIVEGVFVNFTGTVTDINRDKGRLSVLISIFGRETQVDDLQFWQVEKVLNE